MTKWKYTLATGKALKTAIQSDENEETLLALKKCYEELHKVMPEWYDECDLESDADEIDNQLDNCENYLDYDMTEDDIQKEVNCLLDKFYNFCDYARVWVGL